MSTKSANPTFATPANNGTAPAEATLDLMQIQFDPAWALRSSPAVLVRRRVLPLLLLDGHLLVAAAGAVDPATERYFRKLADAPVRFVNATADSVRTLQARLFGDLSEALTQNQPPLDIARSTPGDIQAEELGELSVGLLKGAVLRRASDIHFNVERSGEVRVRVRTDGQLADLARFPANARAPLFNRFKVMARMDIAEKRAPQDGGFRFEAGSGFAPIEIRAASIPSRFGERLTLRLQGTGNDLTALASLGMSPSQQALFSRALRLPHGIILLTGPTGSGKSTTLYACLRELLQDQSLNIMTVEDPVEVDVDGTIQTEVDRRGEKVSFASSLRSILRHDPDVIMIGEIRDRETAELAVRAALTGHLVLSTLHTNTALGAVSRLIDLGLDRFLLGSVLRLVAAQRLIRRVCPHCAEESSLTVEQQRLLSLTEPHTQHRGRGCLHCAGNGFIGRAGLFEVVPVEAELARRITHGSLDSLEADLNDLARARGFSGLREDGLAKLRSGEVSADDLITVTLEA